MLSIRRPSIDASRTKYSLQYGGYEVARPVGGAEDFDPRPVRKEERPELENLVISGKGLCRRSARRAETGDEERREQEAAVPVTHLQHELGVTSEMNQ